MNAISLRARPRSVLMAIVAVAQGECRLIQQEFVELKNDFGQTPEQSVGGIRLSSNVPTSLPSEFQSNKSWVFASSATLLLLTQRLVCCIDRLNSRPNSRRSSTPR